MRGQSGPITEQQTFSPPPVKNIGPSTEPWQAFVPGWDYQAETGMGTSAPIFPVGAPHYRWFNREAALAAFFLGPSHAVLIWF